MHGTTQPHDLVERLLSLSTTQDCIVIVDESSTVNLRWAQNALTTNGSGHGRKVTVIAIADRRQGRSVGVVSSSGAAEADLIRLVQAAEDAAHANEAAEDSLPLLSGRPPSAHFHDPPAATSPHLLMDFAAALGAVLGRAHAEGIHLYGFATHNMTSSYLGTSTGLRLRHDQPSGTVQMNARSADHSRSTWVGRATQDFADIDLDEVENELLTRLHWAQRRIDLPPGNYETILPPSAVADLLVYQMWCATARDAVEGRSAFSAANGHTLLGQQICSLPLTLLSDPHFPGLECPPFSLVHVPGDDIAAFDDEASVFDNGLPLERTDWIHEGTLNRLVATRHGARVTGLPVAPSIGNLILESSSRRTLEDMVASTQHGLLLTCLWSIRPVDPSTLLLTGLTRDGTYLIENGEVTAEINNFRFNESPLSLLGRAAEASASQRTLCREWGDWFTRAAAPALRIPDFNMSSTSRSI